MIQQTYWDHEEAEPEDRRYTQDFWSWLKQQPQDAWLLWVRHANWDNSDWIMEEMIGDPACDLAIVSWIFWTADPAYKVRNPDDDLGGIVTKIVTNVERNFYSRSELYYDRREVFGNVHHYIRALREADKPPFRLPRELCGPFDGRHAQIPANYDRQTEDDLSELFEYMDGGLPRSEREHQEWTTSNFSIEGNAKLPDCSSAPLAKLAHLDDIGYLQAIFGTSDNYRRATLKARKASQYRAFAERTGANPDQKQFLIGFGFLAFAALLLAPLILR